MWKWVLAGLAALLAVGAATALLIGVKLFRPEWLHRDLSREFAVTGLAVGRATSADMTARFGPPPVVHTEHISTVYEYPDLGLLLRFDQRSGILVWYELASPSFATGRGIGVGASMAEVRRAYGKPSSLTPLSEGARMRYHYGTAYVLEFRFDRADRLGRIVFFRA